MKLRRILDNLNLKLELTDKLLDTDLEIEKSFDKYSKTSKGYKLFYEDNPKKYAVIYDQDADNIKLSLFYAPFEGGRVVGTGFDKEGNISCLY